ncbi:Hypothetical protein POVR1_LOCUS292 [uncultured virus]|nr:Hypothetical protein POVR1_LOCUS292 [uncultured virus]
MKSILFRRIDSYLFDFFSSDSSVVQQFKSVLRANNGFISGSFLLQCILGVKYTASDLDIYIPSDGHGWGMPPEIEMFFNDISSIDQRMCNPEYHGMDASIFDYVLDCNLDNGSLVQIVGTRIKKDPRSGWEFVCQNFDLNICQNIYYIDEQGEHLKIRNLSAIFHQVAKVVCDDEQLTKHARLVLARCDKYQKRGFKIKKYSKLVPRMMSLALSSLVELDQNYIFRSNCPLEHYPRGSLQHGSGIDHETFRKICINPIDQERYQKLPIVERYASEVGSESCDELCPIKLITPKIEHLHYWHEGQNLIFVDTSM